MKLKKYALRGLIILAVAVALCMFFARTVQTITTPKIRLTMPGNGRFEEKLSFKGELFFPETEAVKVEAAAKAQVIVDRVYVKPGYWVNEGDTIFTCRVTGSDDELKSLRDEYETKSRELVELDAQNRKSSRNSRQNELYQALYDAQLALATAQLEARMTAGEHGVTLSGEPSGWSKMLALYPEPPAQEVTDAVAKVNEAQKTYETAFEEYCAIMEDKKQRVSESVFEYIKNRAALVAEMDKLAAQIVTKTQEAAGMSTVTAARSGYVTEVRVNENEPYDGTSVAYRLNAAESQPVLRVPLSGVRRTFTEGTRAEITSSGEKTTVERTVIEAGGDKYLYIKLPDSLSGEANSGIRRALSDGVELSITYRAQNATTLLTPSVVRSDGDSSYVYLVQYGRGGFLSSASMKVVKTPVTVIERSDTVVSIAEDLSYQQLADREDRALSDGQSVMEYVE